MMYREKVNAWIDAHRQDYIDMLTRWVRIPSIKSEAEKDAPFGPELRRMLDTAAQDIRAFGFPVRVFDGYAMDATLGAPEAEPVAVLGHLDVVPVGDGWTRSPFGAESENGRIYGRGTSDDKGPSIAALFAMKALAECAVPLRRSVRLILGCDEESGWEDMAWYAAHTQMPEIGFSPDAGFPIINTEKGMLHARLRAPFTAGGVEVKEQIKAIVAAGIPVVAHIGLTPQSVNAFGGHKVQGKTEAAAKKLIADALAVEEAGAFCVVIEGVPAKLAALITKKLTIPTIGIGAGAECDGQVLVYQDMLGMYSDFTPKFVKKFSNVGEVMKAAFEQYINEVQSGVFPSQEHCYAIDDEIIEKLK